MRNPYDKSIFEVPYMGNEDRMASVVLVPELARPRNLKEPLAFRLGPYKRSYSRRGY